MDTREATLPVWRPGHFFSDSAGDALPITDYDADPHRSGRKHAMKPQTAANNPISSIITRIGTVQLENDRTMIIKMNPPIPRRPTPMSLAIHRTRSSSSGRSGCARFAHRTMTTGRKMANTAPTNIRIGNMASAICLKKTSSITQVTPCPTATPVALILLPRLGRAQQARVVKGRGEPCRAEAA
jgi:hypothetical protein